MGQAVFYLTVVRYIIYVCLQIPVVLTGIFSPPNQKPLLLCQASQELGTHGFAI